jgi:hypothetical protein
MSYLTLDADRLVRDAVDAYLEGRLRPESRGDCVYATRNNKYRIIDGVVQEATDTSLLEAELVGWLLEELGQPLIEARWRPYARAIFVDKRTRHVVVTSRTLDRTVVKGDAPPPGERSRRTPGVIPPSPPIPMLKSTPPPGDGSPTPFSVGKDVREMALSVSEHERPTSRPPPMDEKTVAKDRSSYEDLLEASRAPDWSDKSATIPRAPRPPSSTEATTVAEIEVLDEDDIIPEDTGPKS